MYIRNWHKLANTSVHTHFEKKYNYKILLILFKQKCTHTYVNKVFQRLHYDQLFIIRSSSYNFGYQGGPNF